LLPDGGDLYEPWYALIWIEQQNHARKRWILLTADVSTCNRSQRQASCAAVK
jgi:hypothetical protein